MRISLPLLLVPMPNPVPLATKEEEERRAWVTTHHEVVRLIKECFGDRFSNNEIFDRLKISRRTGYRALGNDERIGKAPGRKPKIAEETIREMIDYIESGGCNDVGNVWKHLAEKFAPDCNPKTVQDAVKKSGFKNYHSESSIEYLTPWLCSTPSSEEDELSGSSDNVKLEPLLQEQLPDNQMAPIEEDAAAEQLQQEQNANEHAQQVEQAQQAEQMQREQQQQQQNVFDPALHQTPPQSAHEILRDAINTAPEQHIRYVLHEITNRDPPAMQIAHQYLCSQFPAPPAPPVAQMSAPPPLGGNPLAPTQLRSNANPLEAEIINTKGRRIAICRRCAQHFDRAENTMESRNCLYHKGSPQKTDPNSSGTIETDPTAFIWSCCGGNGDVRGCCRAMHTTKKKRKYSSKKRDATTAGLDDSGDDVDESTIMETPHMTPSAPPEHYDPQMSQQQAQALQGHPHLGAQMVNDPNIDSSLQDLQPPMHGQQQMQMANIQMGAPQAAMQSGHATPQAIDSKLDLSALQMASQQPPPQQQNS